MLLMVQSFLISALAIFLIYLTYTGYRNRKNIKRFFTHFSLKEIVLLVISFSLICMQLWCHEKMSLLMMQEDINQLHYVFYNFINLISMIFSIGIILSFIPKGVQIDNEKLLLVLAIGTEQLATTMLTIELGIYSIQTKLLAYAVIITVPTYFAIIFNKLYER